MKETSEREKSRSYRTKNEKCKIKMQTNMIYMTCMPHTIIYDMKYECMNINIACVLQ